MRRLAYVTVLCWLACLVQTPVAVAAAPAAGLIAYLQDDLGINETQARGGLGALLVFARDRLPQTQFNDLASRMPNAEQIIEQVRARGIVTHPLDDRDDYVAALGNLGISPPVAEKFAPAVLGWLGAKGFDTERDILAGVLD